MNIIRSLVIAIAFLLPTAVFIETAQAAPAQSLSYSWTAPTTRADGSALSSSEIASYTIYYTIDAGAEQKVSVTPGTSTSKTVSLTLAAKSTPYNIVSTITATDTSGLESARSNSVTTKFTVLPAIPTAPGNFTLTIACANGSCTLVIQ